MANRSGYGWNEEAHIPDVPEDAWMNLKEVLEHDNFFFVTLGLLIINF